MKALVKSIKDQLVALHEDEEGAAMIEYSILIGLIAAAVIASIAFVSGWIVDAWQELVDILTDNPVGGAAAGG